MIGSYQHTFELHWAGKQGSLTGREEVSLASAFLSDHLFLQVSDGFGMLSVE